MDKKIEVLSTTRIKYSSDLYKIVDSLNRTLKRAGPHVRISIRRKR